MGIFGIGDVFFFDVFFTADSFFVYTDYYCIVAQIILMSLLTLDLPDFLLVQKAYFQGL